MARRRIAPVHSSRAGGTFFFEVDMAPGPQQIGVTGDNAFEVLYGRAWMCVWDSVDNTLKAYQQRADSVEEWDQVTTLLPPLFGAPMPTNARHMTFAFDQSARVIVVYELAGTIYVTRWDTGTQSYAQNVTFAGVDPSIVVDAAVTDPRGYPNTSAWNVRDLYYAGIRILFEWIPNGQWLESAIPDSDLVLFYLSSDRTTVSARVQRELYAAVRQIHQYADPVTLDRAVAIYSRYQLLVADAATGAPLANMLVSSDYIGDMIVNPRVTERLTLGVTPEGMAATTEIYPATDEDTLGLTVTPETMEAVANVYPEEDDDALDLGVALEVMHVVTDIYPEEVEDGLDLAIALETMENRFNVYEAEDEDALSLGVTLEVIRVTTI